LAQYQALKSLGYQTSRWFRRIIFAETAAAAFGFGIFAYMYSSHVTSERYDGFTFGLIGGLVGGAIAGLFTGRLLLRLLSTTSDPKVNA
jgi:ABC-type branched-subunit amino acid transport system permease subunit